MINQQNKTSETTESKQLQDILNNQILMKNQIFAIVERMEQHNVMYQSSD